jgi:hypothetical protein
MALLECITFVLLIMKTQTLQIRNVPVDLKKKADKRARQEGLKNIQEVLRAFMLAFAKGQVEINFAWGVGLSKHDERVGKEIEAGALTWRKPGESMMSFLDRLENEPLPRIPRKLGEKVSKASKKKQDTESVDRSAVEAVGTKSA